MFDLVFFSTYALLVIVCASLAVLYWRERDDRLTQDRILASYRDQLQTLHHENGTLFENGREVGFCYGWRSGRAELIRQFYDQRDH